MPSLTYSSINKPISSPAPDLRRPAWQPQAAPPYPGRRLRLILQQPALPRYRIPVFAELARRPGIDLKVLYGSLPGLPNATPDGFNALYAPFWHKRLLGHPVYWHQAQLACATRKHTDVLLLSWDVHFASLVPTMLRAKANNVPVILWGHGYSKNEAWWRRGLREQVARLASAIVFYNHSTADRFLKAGWDPNRIFVALNALDQEPIQAAREWWQEHPEELAAFRQEHRLDDGPTLLFVSRLDASNRVDLLLQAAARLRSLHPDLNVVIVGTGPDLPRLQHLAATLQLANRVHFPGTIYEENRLAPWFLSADVFCYPTNIGLSLLHAFGYGLPVVTDDAIHQQNPEIEALRDGVNGLLYRHGDLHSLVDALDRLLSNPTQIRRMGREAQQTAIKTFTLSNMVDGFEAAVRHCAKQIGIELPGPTPENQASPAPTSDAASAKPGLAIISNSHAPYRTHLHLRVAREIPNIKLWTLFTHQMAYAPWAFDLPEEIGPVLFGRNQRVDQQSNPFYALREWTKAGRIIRWMRQTNVRAVVVLGYNDLGRLRIIRWCRRNNIPCFVWGDSNIRDERHMPPAKQALKKFLVSRILGWCTGALACGSLGQAYFRKYGVSDNRIFLFTLEPDYSLIQQFPPAGVDEARKRYKLPPARRRIIYSGRLVPVKRVDLLIDAFAAIADRRPDWDLLIVGDGPLRDALTARVPAPLRDRITWTGFVKNQDDVTALYLASDALVLPSDAEPWALVINEAVAAGLAVVSSDAPGASAELVRDGHNGRIFPAGDLHALTDALLDVTDPAKIDAMKSASPAILHQWRTRHDPIAGLRQALEFARMI